jgi:hypothetical protein
MARPLGHTPKQGTRVRDGTGRAANLLCRFGTWHIILIQYPPRHVTPNSASLLFTLDQPTGDTAASRISMRTPFRSTNLPESYHVTPRFGEIPRILAYASGLTSDFPLDGYPHCTDNRPKPSLKTRILCLASLFGLVGSAISQVPTADSYFATETPIAKAGLLANIGPNGAKSSGAKVCRNVPTYYLHLCSLRLESSLPVPVLSTRTICTLGSATRHLYSRLLRIKLLLDKIFRYAVISITFSTLKPRCNTCVTPVGLSIPAASENQNSPSMALRSRAHGVAPSEVCP